MRRKYRRRPWSKQEDRTLRRLYPATPMAVLKQTLNRSSNSIYMHAAILGLHRTDAFIADSSRARSLARTGAARGNIYPKGHRPWNAGLKGMLPGYRPSIATEFKKGQRPQTWRPLGSVRTDSEGYRSRKMTDTGYSPRDWRMLHVLLWERYRAPIPKGHVVIFKDKDRTHIKIANLECISRRDLARRNSYWTKYPPALARLIQLQGALNRQINRRSHAERN